VATNDPYATTQQLAQRLNRGETWTDDEAAVVTNLLAYCSRELDRLSGRHYWQSASGVARTFTARSYDKLFVPDLVSLSAVATDEDGDGTYENTWTADTDYLLKPFNAAEVSWPYTQLIVGPRGSYAFPVGVPKGVQLTGVWGWPAVPDQAREFVLLEAARLWAQGKSPSGVVASPELGTFMVEPDIHPQSRLMLAQLKRVRVR